ncbi:CsbD family protein [Sphingomonas sp. R3G8C]
MGELTNKISAASNKVVGNDKEAIGKATDNEKLVVEGEA